MKNENKHKIFDELFKEELKLIHSERVRNYDISQNSLDSKSERGHSYGIYTGLGITLSILGRR